MLILEFIPYNPSDWESFIPSYSFFCPEGIFWIQHFRRNFRETQEEFLEHVEAMNAYSLAWDNFIERSIAGKIAKQMKEL